MRPIKQANLISIKNNDGKFPHVQNKKYHSSLLPNSIRCIICGPSNCGKTNVMISLLEDKNGLKFKNVYIYCKSLYQPKYVYLRNLLKPIKGMGYFEFNNDAQIIHPSQARNNSVFIFDDVACDKQSIIREFFSMGRHKFVDCFYLCQTYAHIPKHLIRDNVNFLIIFKQDETNLKHIYNDHVNPDMSFSQFCKLCQLCWQDNYSFLVISKDDDIQKGRYRKGFNHYVQL